MALQDIQEQYIPRENKFYREHYHQVIMGVMLLLVLVSLVNGMLLYEIANRPLPVFSAIQPNAKSMALTPYTTPNLQPDVILRFASQAATVAYTFDFANYKDQINAARSYFTNNGWQDYTASVNSVISTIVANQLAANGVVAGQPVINNQGNINGIGNDINDPNYAWRVAIPFIVTYQSSSTTETRNFMVLVTIVKVPTTVSAQGIGIDQFVMYQTGTI